MSRLLAVVGLLFVFGLFGAVERVGAQRPAPALGVLLSHSTRSETPFAEPIVLTTMEVEWVLPISNDGWWGLEYAAAAIGAVVQKNPTGVLETSPTEWIVWNPPPAATTFGGGIRAAGMRAWLGGARFRLQADLAGGVLYFGRPLLAANATRFNFTGSGSLGLRIAAGEGGHLVLGYRVQHVSNAGMGEVNPGLDAHQIYLGAWVR